MYQIAYYFMLLMIYSFIGWVYESVLCSITQKTLVNRGFLNGPICPIYGFGALSVILLLKDIQHNLIALFLASMVVTGVLEYLTSYLLEHFFHAKWWDYSDQPFQIEGRVCLLGVTVFGLMSVLLIRVVNPWICARVDRISQGILYLLDSIFFVLGSCDFTVTVVHLLRMNTRLQEIQSAINAYKEEYRQNLARDMESLRRSLEAKWEERLEEKDRLRGLLEEKLQSGERWKLQWEARMDAFENSRFHSERIKKLLEAHKYQDRRILKAFPKMHSTTYREAFEKLKKHLDA